MAPRRPPPVSQIPEVPPATVSVVNEFPEDLYEAMRNFVRSHPSWDQYRLMQVALAGFLFQQGSRERAVARHYLDGLFDRGGASEAGAAPLVQGEVTAATLPQGVAPQVTPQATATPLGPLPVPPRLASLPLAGGATERSGGAPSPGGLPAEQPAPAFSAPPRPPLPLRFDGAAGTAAAHRPGPPLPPQRSR